MKVVPNEGIGAFSSVIRVLHRIPLSSLIVCESVFSLTSPFAFLIASVVWDGMKIHTTGCPCTYSQHEEFYALDRDGPRIRQIPVANRQIWEDGPPYSRYLPERASLFFWLCHTSFINADEHDLLRLSGLTFQFWPTEFFVLLSYVMSNQNQVRVCVEALWGLLPVA
ncbi:hypothetical protein Y032_0313g2188 [Ancylostoma ceylanicum]|uniref:Uncharacterized protein n=1 Tax=Ancylostoma ceylanicum TaxID=53326 RepID=A0A016S1X8_9BILA|nr:hypothetical protein Y032_0313g2188 [Ancylostoma ceylanicum]